jgi:hypothetical protein
MCRFIAPNIIKVVSHLIQEFGDKVKNPLKNSLMVKSLCRNQTQQTHAL